MAYYIERKIHRRGKGLGALLIVSVEEGTGKTALCAGLAVNFLNDGRKVGYVGSAGETAAAFMKKIAGLDVIGRSDLKGYDVVLAESRLGTSNGDETSKAAYAAAKDMKAKVIAVEVYRRKPAFH